MAQVTGTLSKMISHLGDPVEYHLPVGEQKLALNPLLRQSLKLTYSGRIFCDACGRKTSKSYAQGHCYPCMMKLARCDMCVLKPEKCHYDQGTCREPDWGDTHCMIPHYVYLANTSGLKVGITRHSQVPTRWIDQGAIQALPILEAGTRHISGLAEIALARHLTDKTNWRAMLKGDVDKIDLHEQADQVLLQVAQEVAEISSNFGDQALHRMEADMVEINYPVLEYPTKISSHNFDKNPAVEGVLRGIKGQYLIFDSGVINIRKFTSYEVTAEY